MSETQAIDWESRYREGTAGWERRGLNPAFLAWREAASLVPCRILVPGGGRSLEPLALAEAGFDVTVVDRRPARLPRSARISNGSTFRPASSSPICSRGTRTSRSMRSMTRPVSARCRPGCGRVMRGASTAGCGRTGCSSSCSCKATAPAGRRFIAMSMPCDTCSRHPRGPGRGRFQIGSSIHRG